MQRNRRMKIADRQQPLMPENISAMRALGTGDIDIDPNMAGRPRQAAAHAVPDEAENGEGNVEAVLLDYWWSPDLISGREHKRKTMAMHWCWTHYWAGSGDVWKPQAADNDKETFWYGENYHRQRNADSGAYAWMIIRRKCSAENHLILFDLSATNSRRNLLDKHCNPASYLDERDGSTLTGTTPCSLPGTHTAMRNREDARPFIERFVTALYKQAAPAARRETVGIRPAADINATSQKTTSGLTLKRDESVTVIVFTNFVVFPGAYRRDIAAPRLFGLVMELNDRWP